MSPLWTRTSNGVAKDPLSFMGGLSLSCWFQVTSSAHQPPSRFVFSHRHHHPHSRFFHHSSQDGDALQTAPLFKILTHSSWYKHQTSSMDWVRHPSLSVAILYGQRFTCRYNMSSKSIRLHGQRLKTPPRILHGQRFLRRYKNLVLMTTKHTSSPQLNLPTPNRLPAQHMTRFLQWSVPSLWNIVGQDFFLSSLTSTFGIYHPLVSIILLGGNIYHFQILLLWLWLDTTKYGG